MNINQTVDAVHYEIAHHEIAGAGNHILPETSARKLTRVKMSSETNSFRTNGSTVFSKPYICSTYSRAAAKFAI